MLSIRNDLLHLYCNSKHKIVNNTLILQLFICLDPLANN
jgi:hypothetical protein